MTRRNDYGEPQCGAGTPSADRLLEAFESERPRLRRMAYSITGSIAEAEDCVQEAWLRLQRADVSTVVRELRSWLTTTVGRLALDALGSARSRREQYVGTWLPEPLVERDEAPDAGDRVLFAESLTMALLVVLERLSAAERAAFLLHDIFGLTFEEVAEVVNRSPGAVRQLASRARAYRAWASPFSTDTRGTAEARERFCRGVLGRRSQSTRCAARPRRGAAGGRRQGGGGRGRTAGSGAGRARLARRGAGPSANIARRPGERSAGNRVA